MLDKLYNLSWTVSRGPFVAGMADLFTKGRCTTGEAPRYREDAIAATELYITRQN